MALKFGQTFAKAIRQRLPLVGDKWHLDEIVIKITGRTHWLWRAVDQYGIALDVLVQSRRDANAARRPLRKLLKRQSHAPRLMITDKLASYPAAKKDLMPGVEHRWHKGAQRQGREFTPADTTTRAADEALQITGLGATLPLGARPDQQPFHLRGNHVTAA